MWIVLLAAISGLFLPPVGPPVGPLDQGPAELRAATGQGSSQTGQTGQTDPEERFRKALQVWEAGDRAAALALLERFGKEHADSVWGERALLVLGRWYREQGLSGPAADRLEEYAGRAPLLRDYGLYLLGMVRAEAGERVRAAEAFDRLAGEERGSVWIPDVLMEGGEALAAAGRFGAASDRFRRFIREFPRHPDLPRVKLALGRCLLSEAEGEAILALRRLWVEHPDTPEAEEAERLLKEARASRSERDWTGEEYAARAARLFQRGQWKAALTAWQLARDRQWHPEPNDWYQMAQARFHLKQHDQAIPLYRKAGGIAGQLGELKAQYRLGRYQQALAMGHRLWARDPERPEAQEGRYLTAFVLKDQGRHADAIQTWIDLIDRAPEGGFATQALWQAGWTAYQQGEYARARAAFQRLVREYPHSTLTDQAAYWEARAQERLGEGEAARQIYRRLTRLPRWSYYVYRAADRLRATYGESVPSPAPPSIQDPMSIGADPSPDARRGPDLHERRGLELALLGFTAEARREARRAAEARDLDLWSVIRVGSLLSEWGEQGEALRLAAQWQGRTEAEQVDRYWQLLYPRAFFPRPARGPDPLLVEAVIREESRFDPLAVSRAGAIGLMQILPETGVVLARRIGREIPSARTLFDVDRNLELGVAYLDQLLAEFDQNILLAVASYNAGPRAVRGWAARNGRLDRDEFVEAIPYRETRLYVKRVLHSYWEYQRIYRDRDGDP